jgi:hypothetical protein
MRSARLGISVCFSLLSLSALGQQSQPAPVTTPPIQDPQAVFVLNQALNIAGGVAGFNAVTDYTSFGDFTYHGTQDLNGPATIKALGMNEFRMDATLPTGTKSWIVFEGVTTTKTEDGTTLQLPFTESATPRKMIIPAPYRAAMFPGGLANPFGQLADLMNNPLYSFTYKGVVEIDGTKVHDIQVQRTVPGQIDIYSEYHTRDFFLDVLSLRVLMVQDMVPKGIVQQMRYSDYRISGGLLMPFSISESLAGREAWTIQLNALTLNSGLQDRAFQL